MSKPVYGSATAEMSLSRRLDPQAVLVQPGVSSSVNGVGGKSDVFMLGRIRAGHGIYNGRGRGASCSASKVGAPNKVLGESSSGGYARYCLSAP